MTGLNQMSAIRDEAEERNELKHVPDLRLDRIQSSNEGVDEIRKH